MVKIIYTGTNYWEFVDGDVAPLAVANCHAGIWGFPICIDELGDVAPVFCLDVMRDLRDLSSDCKSARVFD